MPKLAVNKRAKFDYDLGEIFEGGLVLTGSEVKSAKAGHIQLKGAFLHVKDGELWLRNAFIAPYKPAGEQVDYKPDRERKVLVHRKEIDKLLGKAESERLTLVPVSVYTRGNLVKLEFAIGRGKKEHEKRDAIKKRDVDRQIREHLKE